MSENREEKLTSPERADAGAAKAGANRKKEEEKPKEPSPNQPLLDQLVRLIREQAGEEAVVAADINEPSDHMPVIEIRGENWPDVARLLKEHPDCQFRYLRNIAGVDYEEHMEVVYFFLNMETRREVCIKVKTDRDNPSVPSITHLWSTADWNEREIYDLLGIRFPGHPDLRRIMLPDDWVGHPLRKDYEPLDPEV